MRTDYYKVLLLGQSGKGKTYSARNLNPMTTGFINVENKPLPFQNKFKFHAKPKTYAGVIKALQDFAANKEIDCIFIDSFSAYSDLLLEEFRKNFKGFEIWSNYNAKIGEFFKEVKNAEKEVFVTGHYEVLMTEGDKEKRAKVKAKEWEGVIEKEFTMVLYADSKFKDTKNEYFLLTAGDGISAKCPPDILDNQLKVNNDAKEIFEMIKKFTTV